MTSLLVDTFFAVIATAFSPLVVFSYYAESKLKGAGLGFIQGFGVYLIAYLNIDKIYNWIPIYAVLCVFSGFFLGYLGETNLRKSIKRTD